MTIRQEESTPIGDYFHDRGIQKIFEKLSEKVDDFEIDTEEINSYCDGLIQSLKGLKAHVKKVESERKKQLAQEKIEDLVQKGYD